jgi:hypothetical protein
MRLISFLLMVSAITVAVMASSHAQDDSLKAAAENKSKDGTVENETKVVTERIFAYYLHGDRRCATCRKLEAYSEEALRVGFPEMLKDSTLIWGTINYDRKENEHYLEDYNLFTKALILSRVRDGSEIEWKNLDRIWELVNDKDKYLDYVRKETEAFLKQGNK